MKKLIFITFSVFMLLLCCKPKDSARNDQANQSKIFEALDMSWKDLTVRQKIGQIMLMLPDRKKELELGNGSLKEYFKRYPVTGYFMGWKLFDGVAYEDRFDCFTE